jgi:predicted metal-binding protein
MSVANARRAAVTVKVTRCMARCSRSKGCSVVWGAAGVTPVLVAGRMAGAWGAEEY